MGYHPYAEPSSSGFRESIHLCYTTTNTTNMVDFIQWFYRFGGICLWISIFHQIGTGLCGKHLENMTDIALEFERVSKKFKKDVKALVLSPHYYSLDEFIIFAQQYNKNI